MKNLLLCIFCNISVGCFAQVHSAMPLEAGLFYNNAMQSLKPEIKELIQKKAGALKHRNVKPDSLVNTLRDEDLLKKMHKQDLEALTVLILVQASKNADKELKDLVINLGKNEEKRLSENNGTASILEYKSKMANTISLVMKKLSGSQEAFINNYK